MTDSIYKEYQNKYYNPTDNDKKPGDNDNWKSIQKGFHDITTTQLETSAGLTLGKGTEDETSVTAAELKALLEGNLIIQATTLNASSGHGISANSTTGHRGNITFTVENIEDGTYKVLSSGLRSAVTGVYISGYLIRPASGIAIVNGTFSAGVEYVAYNTKSTPENDITLTVYLTLVKTK